MLSVERKGKKEGKWLWRKEKEEEKLVEKRRLRKER